MADKQTGTGARGNSEQRPRGQGAEKRGNDTKVSTDNRSHQIKSDNKSSRQTGNRANR